MYNDEILNIDDRVEIYFSSVMGVKSNKENINHISDVYPYKLKREISNIHDIYDVKSESPDLKETQKNIRNQKIKLISSLALFECDLDFRCLNDEEKLIGEFINVYNYCLNKGYLDVAEYYLDFLFKRGLVDENFALKGIQDITLGYSNLSILANVDKRENIVRLASKMKKNPYKSLSKMMKVDDFIRIYNETGIKVDWDGLLVVVHPDKLLEKKDFLNKMVTGKN